MLKFKIKKGILKNVALIKKASFFDKHFQTTFSCTLKQKNVQDEIKRAEEIIDFKKPKKKKIFSLLLLIFNFCVIIGIFTYYFSTSEIESIGDFFREDIVWKFLILAVGMLILSLFLETIKIAQLIYKSTGKIRMWLSFKTHILGKYYDNITPFAVGGQPFQIFYLNKKGVKGEIATSIPLVKQMFNTVAFLLISLSVLIANIFLPITNNVVIIIIAIIGTVFNGGVVALVLLFSISKRIGPGIVIKILKLLSKLKIVKNYKATFFKVSRFVKNYQKAVKSVSKNVWIVISQILLSLLNLFAIYAIVYFIYLAFIPNGRISIFYIFACMNLCELCGGIMPLPGGSGAAEISFDALFGKLFVSNPGALPFAMLSWRILTYFFFVGYGGIQVISSSIKNKIIKKKVKN